MASVHFTHSNKSLGDLIIDTGVDTAEWAYGLNAVTYPTYGGEVVQILSVYIDDLMISGTLTTYQQLEAVYQYFTKYMSIATQGNNPHPDAGASAYNLDPMHFHYPARNWTFKIYPKSAPGFMYDRDTTAPRWQISAHVVDDSTDLSIIRNGIQGAAVKRLNLTNANSLPTSGKVAMNLDALSITGNISPKFTDPNTDPFESFDQGAQQEQQDISKYADYYNSLIPAYMRGNFENLTTSIGSQPNFGAAGSRGSHTNQQVSPVPKVRGHHH